MKSRMFSVMSVGVVIAIWSLSAASAMAQVGGAVGGKSEKDSPDKTKNDGRPSIQIRTEGPQGIRIQISGPEGVRIGSHLDTPSKQRHTVGGGFGARFGAPHSTKAKRLTAKERLDLSEEARLLRKHGATRQAKPGRRAGGGISARIEGRQLTKAAPLPTGTRLYRVEKELAELRHQIEALRKAVEKLQK